MVANLSDIAAMGGLPKYALVTIGLPKSISVKNVISIYDGMTTIAKRYNCKIIGGDTFFSHSGIFISIALLGEVEKKFLVKRSGAKKGDLICVTGDLGQAQAGLELLKENPRKKSPLTRKFLNPFPRINEARILVKNLKISSMIDISDGLSTDLWHICRLSKAGALIDAAKVPVSKEAKKTDDPLYAALNDGEDFELLFTLSEPNCRKLLNTWNEPLQITQIGTITDTAKMQIKMPDGQTHDLQPAGYNHLG